MMLACTMGPIGLGGDSAHVHRVDTLHQRQHGVGVGQVRRATSSPGQALVLAIGPGGTWHRADARAQGVGPVAGRSVSSRRWKGRCGHGRSPDGATLTFHEACRISRPREVCRMLSNPGFDSRGASVKCQTGSLVRRACASDGRASEAGMAMTRDRGGSRGRGRGQRGLGKDPRRQPSAVAGDKLPTEAAIMTVLASAADCSANRFPGW